MAPYVTRLDQAAPPPAVEQLGGKAANLATLLAAGFPVPPALAVTTAAFELALAPHRQHLDAIRRGFDLRDPAQAARAAAVADALANLRVPDRVAAELRAELAAFGDAPLAVRSSATAEDRADASFAGQYQTVLGPRGEAAVLEAVLSCWRSFFAANALVARARADDGAGAEGAMAVLVQPVVEAECAGVAFSVDPVRRDQDTVVVSAVWGLGVGAVDGSVAADTYRIRRNGSYIPIGPGGLGGFDVDERRVTEKADAFVLDGCGVQLTPVAEERRRAACLPDGWLRRVASFAVAAEALFGRPQDIEWAIEGTRVWIVQSRPITTLPPELLRPHFPVAWADAEEARHLWVIDRHSRRRVPLPLEDEVNELWGLARYEAALQNGMSFPHPEVTERQKRVNGRRYLATVPIDLRPGDRRARMNASLDRMEHLRQRNMNVWDHSAITVVPATERLAAVDLARLDGPGLADHLEDAFGVFRHSWVAHWLGGRDRLRAPYLAAYAAVAGTSGQASDDAAMQLVQGDDTVLTRLIDGLHELGCAARAVPSVARLVAERPPDAAARLAELPEAALFNAVLAAFMAVYADRSGSGFGSNVSVLTPTWRDEPWLVLALIAPDLDPTVPSPAAQRERARRERDQRADGLCAACSNPDAVTAFRSLLTAARRQATSLEDHNHYIDELSYGQLRAAILAAGRWLSAHGALDAIDDVFWLRRDEIVDALTRPPPNGPRADDLHANALRAIVASRRAEHADWEALDPPPVLGVPDPRLTPRPPFRDDTTVAAALDGGRLLGQAASAGRGRGRARIVPMTTLMPAVGPGEVLVAENAGPMWTPVFPILGGLVLDQGVLLQHAAATAREYGIPAVINVGNATRRIRDGDWVTVDGAAGTVEIG
jgi:pyruvate,water dikinase